MPARIVVVHDDLKFVEALTDRLGHQDVASFDDPVRALALLRSARTVEFLITRLTFEDGQSAGLPVARVTRNARPGVRVIFTGDRSQRGGALGLGEFLEEPINPSHVGVIADWLRAECPAPPGFEAGALERRKHYRIYVLDGEDHIRAVHSLMAASDAEAVSLARLLYTSCDDVFESCEVWRGPAMIYENRRLLGGAGETLASLTLRRQRHVLEMEEAIAGSFACIRSSRKFLADMEALRERVAQAGREDVA